MDFCKCCDSVMRRYCYFLLTLFISPLTLHLNSLCRCIWYHCNPWPLKHRGRPFLCYHVLFRRYYIIWLWLKVKWLSRQPRGVFAMAPFLKMFRATNYTSVLSFMLLWKSEHYFHISPGLLCVMWLTCRSCCLSFCISDRLSSLKRSDTGCSTSPFLPPGRWYSPFTFGPCPLHSLQRLRSSFLELDPDSDVPLVTASSAYIKPSTAVMARWVQSVRLRWWASSFLRLFFCSLSLLRASNASSNWPSEMSFKRKASSSWLLSRTVSSTSTLISCFRPSYSTCTF